MRRYETIVIIDSELSDEGREPLLEKIRELIDQYDGLLVNFDEWGSRALAYEIKKKNRGYYARIDYCGTGDLVDELERTFRITDAYLKYMTIVLEKDADIEAIKAEMAEEKAEIARRKAAVEAAREAAAATSAGKAPEPVKAEPEKAKPEASTDTALGEAVEAPKETVEEINEAVAETKAESETPPQQEEEA